MAKIHAQTCAAIQNPTRLVSFTVGGRHGHTVINGNRSQNDAPCVHPQPKHKRASQTHRDVDRVDIIVDPLWVLEVGRHARWGRKGGRLAQIHGGCSQRIDKIGMDKAELCRFS